MDVRGGGARRFRAWKSGVTIRTCTHAESGCELWIIVRGFTHVANVYMDCVQRTMEAAVLEVEGLPRQLELLQGLSGKTAVHT